MTNYGINDIESLSFKDGVRQRIPMYLGTDDTEGIYQALKEVINNSTDEALMGFGNTITIIINENTGFVSVEDEGRGIPFGIRDNGENVLVSIFSKSHTGGKFNNKNYTTVSGLNGIGIKATCLSSEEFYATSYRDGKKAMIEFKKGDLISYKEDKTTHKNGTFVKFKPDIVVFKNMTEGFTYDKICENIKVISYLTKGVKFIVKNEVNKKEEIFCSENGIADFIKDNVSKPLMKSPIICSASDGTDEVEVAFMWTAGAEKSYVFVNGLICEQGGTPITGAKTTITTSIKRLTGKDFEPDLIRKGLVYAINCKVATPSFANQTKSKINNPNLRTLTSQAFKEGLEDFSNTPEYASIIEMMNKFQKAEEAAEKARQTILSQQKKMNELRKQKVAFLDKLSDAEYLGEDSILCICEGDSAGNSIIAGRDTKKYGVICVRGKMLNGLKETDDEKYYTNNEIELLIYALGIDVNNYNPKKLRYGKIAICVDADDDGYHIALLILANLQRICPQFLKENRVYWLRCPLFIAYDKNMNPLSWYYTDAELSAAKAKGKIVGDLDRIKGLGQLEEADLKATMFSTTGGQKMDLITYSDKAIQRLQELMGEDIVKRKEFVMSRIDFSKYNNI